jgi:hypothetical protein
VHAVLNKLLGLFEELTGEDDHGGGPVTDLVVLGLGDIDEGLGGGVDNVEELDQSGTVIGDGHTASIVDKLVHTAGTEGGLDDVNDGLARVDVGNDLSFA